MFHYQNNIDPSILLALLTKTNDATLVTVYEVVSKGGDTVDITEDLDQLLREGFVDDGDFLKHSDGRCAVEEKGIRLPGDDHPVLLFATAWEDHTSWRGEASRKKAVDERKRVLGDDYELFCQYLAAKAAGSLKPGVSPKASPRRTRVVAKPPVRVVGGKLVQVIPRLPSFDAVAPENVRSIHSRMRHYANSNKTPCDFPHAQHHIVNEDGLSWHKWCTSGNLPTHDREHLYPQELGARWAWMQCVSPKEWGTYTLDEKPMRYQAGIKHGEAIHLNIPTPDIAVVRNLLIHAILPLPRKTS